MIVSANLVSTEPIENVGRRVPLAGICYREMDKKAREFAIFAGEVRRRRKDSKAFSAKDLPLRRRLRQALGPLLQLGQRIEGFAGRQIVDGQGAQLLQQLL